MENASASTGERWKKLCEQAAVETDSQTLLALVSEINRLVEIREAQSRQKSEPQPIRAPLTDGQSAVLLQSSEPKDSKPKPSSNSKIMRDKDSAVA
jgi:hypothetical protein